MELLKGKNAKLTFYLYILLISVCVTSTYGAVTCGDGSKHPSEQCDDGNTVSGDGCASDCKIESGWSCSGSPSVCKRCGDGIVQTGEDCDDGNVVNGDGCNSTCTVEIPWQCQGQPSICVNCGDGIIQDGELCDDGNINSNDGCNSTCYIETQWTCVGSPSTCSRCGDGFIGGLEICDDNNVANGDGCSSSCMIEPDWSCLGQPSVCLSSVACQNQMAYQGDPCDDNNTISNDGCALGVVSSGWVCSSSPSLCRRCGDGIVQSCEHCDDGNANGNDGCSSCAIESGWTCSGYPISTCKKCGDGLMQPGEQCDDGNVNNNDGCSNACLIEPNWSCIAGTPTACKKCGDFIIQWAAGENCDDGNGFQYDGCDSLCRVELGWNCTGGCNPRSGDGLIVGSEQCDDGNNVANDGCHLSMLEPGWNCTGQPSVCVSICGDRIKTAVEICDDGNMEDYDGCTSACQATEGWYCDSDGECSESCGNGIATISESCDDGNVVPGDGCFLCKTERDWICTGYSPSVCTANYITQPETDLLSATTINIGAAVGVPLTLIIVGSIVGFIVYKKRKGQLLDLPRLSGMARASSFFSGSSSSNQTTDYSSGKSGLNSIIVDSDATSYASIPIRMEPTKGYVHVGTLRTKTWEIPFNEIAVQKELGKGAYGVVYEGKWRNQTVAMKRIMGELTNEQLQDFLSEAELMSAILPHENVVQLYGVVSQPPCIVLKYYPNGSLLSYLNSEKELSTRTMFTILKGIAAGCAHLHKEKIVHRDLAARNVLLNQNMCPVVSDFGFARAMNQNMDSGKTKNEVGPIRWMSPESLLKQVYSFKSDIWSFGVTTWEIITREDPFGDFDLVNTALEIVNGRITDHLKFPSNCNPALVRLVKRCWNMDPAQRPTFQEIFDELSAIESRLFKEK